jgi:hypothetical protein
VEPSGTLTICLGLPDGNKIYMPHRRMDACCPAPCLGSAALLSCGPAHYHVGTCIRDFQAVSHRMLSCRKKIRRSLYALCVHAFVTRGRPKHPTSAGCWQGVERVKEPASQSRVVCAGRNRERTVQTCSTKFFPVPPPHIIFLPGSALGVGRQCNRRGSGSQGAKTI